jgi:hypothetical protein
VATASGASRPASSGEARFIAKASASSVPPSLSTRTQRGMLVLGLTVNSRRKSRSSRPARSSRGSS